MRSFLKIRKSSAAQRHANVCRQPIKFSRTREHDEAIILSLGAAYCAGVQAMSVWDNEYYEDECDGYGSEPEDDGERPDKPETQDSGGVANENKD